MLYQILNTRRSRVLYSDKARAAIVLNGLKTNDAICIFAK